MHKRIWGLAFWAFLATTAAGQTPPPPTDAPIWDKPILAQPYDKAPFREIRIPDWVQDTIGCGYTLSVMDSAARERAARHGVRISEMGFVDPF